MNWLSSLLGNLAGEHRYPRTVRAGRIARSLSCSRRKPQCISCHTVCNDRRRLRCHYQLHCRLLLRTSNHLSLCQQQVGTHVPAQSAKGRKEREVLLRPRSHRHTYRQTAPWHTTPYLYPRRSFQDEILEVHPLHHHGRRSVELHPGTAGMVSALSGSRAGTQRQDYGIWRVYQVGHHRPCGYRHRVLHRQMAS